MLKFKWWAVLIWWINIAFLILVYRRIYWKIFEGIKHIDEYGNEFLESRELMSLLKYNKFENFIKL